LYPTFDWLGTRGGLRPQPVFTGIVVNNFNFNFNFFLFLADSYDAALLLRQRVEAMLTLLGLYRNPKKGIWTPTQVRDHLGLTADFNLGMFRAPPDKLRQLAQQASSLFNRAASNACWLQARQLAVFADKAQFLYIAIAPARFFLRKLHNVLATRRGWGGRVRFTHQLRRDLEWWRTVPNRNNGRSIYKPIETAYLHADSSAHGWGAVQNDDPHYHARGFWNEPDRQQHFTWKELRAVRHAVESLLPHLKGPKSSYTKTTPLWSLPSPSSPRGHP
jgi:hypothetical protein